MSAKLQKSKRTVSSQAVPSDIQSSSVGGTTSAKKIARFSSKARLPEGWYLTQEGCVGWSLVDETGRVAAQHPVNNPAVWEQAVCQRGSLFGYFIQLTVPTFMIAEHLAKVKKMFLDHAREDIEKLGALVIPGYARFSIEPKWRDHHEVVFTVKLFTRTGIPAKVLHYPVHPLD